MRNGLDESYRPLGQPGFLPQPPPDLRRPKWFVYACALVAWDHDLQLAGAKVKQRQVRSLGGHGR